MFITDIKEKARENTNFRAVIHTGEHMQLVLMSIPPNGEIGEEVHRVTDQVLFFMEGHGEAIVGGESSPVKKHDVVFVPSGTFHNFKNTGDTDLKLYTLYSPPEHRDGTVQATREEAITDTLVSA